MSVSILRDEVVHYEVLGRGRPLIFLHDWVGSWRYWIPTMQAASISYRTYSIDLWGFGDTAKNPSFYALEEQVSLLNLFLDSLGIGRVALIGHGLGAVVALMFARRFPGSVDRMMSIGMPVTAEAVNPRLRSASPAELADWLLGRTPATQAAWNEAPKADQRAILTSLSSLQSLDIATQLRLAPVPLLMVHGQNDPAIDPPPDGLAGYPEHVHLIQFEGCGHFPMLDEPSKFNRLLTDFLTLQSGVSPAQLQLKEEWRRRVR